MNSTFQSEKLTHSFCEAQRVIEKLTSGTMIDALLLLQKLFALGGRLSRGEAMLIESKLSHLPNELCWRVLLVGHYYCSSFWSNDLPAVYQKHVLWIICF